MKTFIHYSIVTLVFFKRFFQFEYPGTREYLKKNTRKFEYFEIEYFGITISNSFVGIGGITCCEFSSN